MKLIIDIPEELYTYIQSESYDAHLDRRFDYRIRFAVKDGTPLPKGHGRLIDADDYLANTPIRKSAVGTWIKEPYVYDTIMDTPTIIEADKEDDINGKTNSDS